MTDEQNSSGVPSSETSGQPEEKQTVAYESYQKVLGEKKAIQARLREIEENQRLAEEQRLAEQGDYKTMVENKEQQLKALQEQLNGIRNERDLYSKDLSDTWKLQAFYKELPGQIKKSEYINFVDLDSIVFDPETKSVDESTVKSAVSNFMENYPDLVKQKTFKNLPPNAPKGSVNKKSLNSMSMDEQRGALRGALGTILNKGV